MDFFALVFTGRWPVMRRSVFSASSRNLASLPCDAPIETVMAETFGTAYTFPMPNSFASAGAISFW